MLILDHMFKGKTKKITTDFRKDIPEYTDEKIIAILKQRDHYQEEAAQLAIQEAIKRGIINSEQDLFAEEYKVEAIQYSLFPSIRRANNQQKIRRSIARSFVICGVMPFVFGFLQINKGNLIEGSLIVATGVLWIYFSAQLIKHYHRFFVYGLLTESILGISYIMVQLVLLKRFVFFDFFIPIVLFLFVLYGLIFLKRISE